jgi:hypothetical protein
MTTVTLAANGATNFCVTYDGTTCIVTDGKVTRKFKYIKLFTPTYTPHNALLFQLTPYKYLYAGMPIHTFKCREPILSFESPEAIHNDVPYAFAHTPTHILLFTAGVALPKIICGDQNEPYDSLYLHDYPALQKVLGRWLEHNSTYEHTKLNEFGSIAFM